VIEVKDRIPKKPNRIRIVPEGGGAAFYATWERADSPIEDGTPLNKQLFDSIEEGDLYHSELEDIELCAQRVFVAADWSKIVFSRPFSGVPRVFVTVGEDLIGWVKDVTDTSCKVAVRKLSEAIFVEAPVDIFAIYDGGTNP
jgi:hypothetical protein